MYKLKTAIKFFTFFVCIGLISCTSLSEMIWSSEPGQQPWVTPITLKKDSPVTITSQVIFQSEFKTNVSGAICMVGLSDGSSQSAPIQLTWARGGFAGIWSLRLKTPHGEEGPFYAIPQEGHVYESMLSYDPRSCLLMVAVCDVTDGTLIYQDSAVLELKNEEINQGFASSQVVGAQVRSLEITPKFLPVGVKWQFAAESLDRSKDVEIRLIPGVSEPLPGTFAVLGDVNGKLLPLSEEISVVGETVLPLDPVKLSELLGPCALKLAYKEDGEYSVLFSQEVVVGKATVGDIRVSFAPENNTLETAFQIVPDGLIQNADVFCTIRVTRYCLLTGDIHEEEMTVPCGNFDLSSTPVIVTCDVPVDDQGLELWELRVEPSVYVEPDINWDRGMMAQKIIVGVPKTEQEVTALALAKFRLRFVEEFVQQPVSDSHIEGIMAQMTLQGAWKGSWPDIDYRDQRRGGAAKWEPTIHLERVRDLAQGYSDASSRFYRDSTLYERIMDGLSFWYANRAGLINPGYFMNEITVPGLFLDIMLLLGEEPPRHIVSFVATRLDPERDSNDVGANLPWRQLNHLKLAILENDLEGIKRVYARVNQELLLAPELMKEDWRHRRWRSYVQLDLPWGPVEGIQVDYSFHQHGPLLYSGPSYGKGFVVESSRLAYVDGGEFFAAESLKNLVDLILEGQQWMVWKNQFDYSAMGRAIVLNNGADASFLLGVVQRLLKIEDVPRREELVALGEALWRGGPSVIGNRYFWKSDFMVHRREDYYASVRTTSKDAVATEIVSWMNKQGHYLGDGCMFLYRTGDEYKNIFPLWDWLKIPGATIEQKPLPAVNIQHDAIQGAGEVVGAASDGNYGLTAVHLKRDLLSVQKSWYFFDDEIVALGAGISCPTDKQVVTTLNQSLLQGNIHVANEDGVTLLPAEQTASGQLSWIHHDDTGYLILDAKSASVSNHTQTGSWEELDQNGPTDRMANKVFTLWIDHGISPDQDNYAYVVLPGIPYEHMEDYRLDERLVILSNTEVLQGVWHQKLQMLQSTFWKPGSIKLPNDITITTDAPCTLLVQFGQEKVTMTVASLGESGRIVSVDIGMQLCGGDALWDQHRQMSTVRFELPSGEYTGQSVVKELTL